MRVAYYAGVSTAAAAACLVKAFHERPNFYSATVYLSQSNACLLILTNYLLMLSCGVVYGLQRLFYGPLRPIEIEHLSERAWYAVLDTLLAMPSFKEDVGGWLLTMFVLLLAGKVWGWIGEGKVDILEQQPPANPRLFHTRLANSLVFSVIFDIWMTKYCLSVVAADPRPGMMVIFTFEFAILSVFSIFTLCRYMLSLASILITQQQMTKAIAERKAEITAERAAAAAAAAAANTDDADASADEPIEVDENELDVPGWEEKRRWLFGLEMISDFLKLLLYVVFFSVSIAFNGLPMHIMRDVYMTFAAFTKRLSDYVNYKKATSDMNSRYPDATTAEIRDDACIVCREDMIAWNDENIDNQNDAPAPRPRRDEGLRAKKLPCGHILHLRCLKAWLERQQVCPTCRRPVISAGSGTSTVPANAAPAAPQAAAPRANPQQPANAGNGNRARFFNLGPLRVGFLNGPPQQMDNIVNQLRGEQQPQRQVQAVNMPGTLATPQGQLHPAAPVRLSQAELVQFSQRIQREASTLNVERAQLHAIRAMAQELDRLMALHAHTASAQHGPSDVTTGGQRAPSHIPFMDQSMSGVPSQTMDHNNIRLPSGLVLPEGWTLMPLQPLQQPPMLPPIRHLPTMHHFAPGVYNHDQTNPSQTSVASTPQSQPHPGAQPQSQPQPHSHSQPYTGVQQAAPNSAALSSSSDAVRSTTETRQEAAPISSMAVPLDAHGSPLFVPTATSGTTTAPKETSVPPNTTQQPWSSQEWTFPSQSDAIGSGQAVAESSGSSSTKDKAKAKSVAIEEVTDQDL